jgi:hypothetical protein
VSSITIDPSNPMQAGAELAGAFAMPVAVKIANDLPPEARRDFWIGFFCAVCGSVSASIGAPVAAEFLRLMADDMRKIAAGDESMLKVR